VTFAAETAALSRKPIDLLVITLDGCSLTFGVAPCTATGTPCYNTWATCRDRANYTRVNKVFKFSSIDAPLPFSGPRPYLVSARPLPTEIKDKLTIKGRLTLTMADEPDGDVGLDPYLSSRANVPVTSYWRKILARYRYQGRSVELYQGYAGLTEAEYQLRWAGVIDNVRLDRDQVKIEAVDLLQSLDKIEIPPKIKCSLVAELSSSATDATLSDVSPLPSSGYVRIDDEIIQYTGVTAGSNQLTGLTRGAFGTTAATHSADSKVEIVCHITGNPIDVAQAMLTNDPDITVNNPPGAGIDAARVDSTAWTTWRDWPASDLDVDAVITSPTKAGKLFAELLHITGSSAWQNEAQQVTLHRLLHNDPSRSYHAIADDANIVERSARVDLRDDARLTRVVMYWDKDPLGKDDEHDGYRAIEAVIDIGAESDNDYGDIKSDTIYNRWYRRGQPATQEDLSRTITAHTRRALHRSIDPRPRITLSVELKDEGILVGDHVRLSTDELLQPDGNPLDRAPYRVVRREPAGATVKLTLEALPSSPVVIIAPSGTTTDYSSASESDLEYSYIAESDGQMPDGAPGYTIY